MSWEDQGRELNGQFGHGKAGVRGKSSTDGRDSLFNANNLGQRIDAIAHTALAHMPRDDRKRGNASFNPQSLGRLREAMTAWVGARKLSNEAFGRRFVDPATSGGVIEKLRRAAESVRTATNHKDLVVASSELAAAMQSIGLDKWPGFLSDAGNRAGADPLRASGALAQATTPKTATDSNRGGNAGATTSSGPYVAVDPEQWIGKPSVGSGECVPLVQAAAGAPHSGAWRPGAPVRGNRDIPLGTVIATFDANGHYTGHAALYFGQDEHKLQVIDQWNNRDRQGNITSQHTPSKRTMPFDNPRPHDPVDSGDSYRVVE